MQGAISGTLAANQVTKYHGAELVLERVSLVVGPRSRIGVVGPNGIGKSALLRILGRARAPRLGHGQADARLADGGVSRAGARWAGRQHAARLPREAHGAVVERGAFRLGPIDLEVTWGERLCDPRPERERQDDAQRGPAALSDNTSYDSPYDDEETPNGFLYAYRAGSLDQPDNGALRAAFELRVPLVYFVGTRPRWYRPIYPSFVVEDDPTGRRVLVAPGALTGPLDEQEPTFVEDPLERRYIVRETRVRVHLARRLREDEDGPMLELLKGFHDQPIVLPAKKAWRPDRERLALRFERFAASA